MNFQHIIRTWPRGWQKKISDTIMPKKVPVILLPPLPFQKSSATIIIKKKFPPPYHFSIWPTKNFSMHTNTTIQCEKFIEGSLLSKKTRNTKNTLSVACLKKLSNEELLLLPLSDFWDVRNKKWMSNVFGTFGEQNSSRMKRLFWKSKFEWSIPGIVPPP